MSRLQIPVVGKVLYATGDVRLRIFVDLHLKDNAGGWTKEEFRVDTGADITTFPAHLGQQLDLPMPQQAIPGMKHPQTGLEMRSGLLRFRIDGMDATEYTVPVMFLGDPAVAPNPSQPATFPRKLLQPLHLIDRLRFIEDKDPATGSLYGDLTIEKK